MLSYIQLGTIIISIFTVKNWPDHKKVCDDIKGAANNY